MYEKARPIEARVSEIGALVKRLDNHASIKKPSQENASDNKIVNILNSRPTLHEMTIL